MYLAVTSSDSPEERRWYGTPARGVVTIGAAAEDDIQIRGHHIAARHIRLRFEARRVLLEVGIWWGVRLDGRTLRSEPELREGSVVTLGPWSARLIAEPPAGIEPIDETFFSALGEEDGRAVYADSLEERGRAAEAELLRGTPASERYRLAARTPPAWRQRFLPIAIEACKRAECPRAWRGRCETCERDIPLFENVGAAREHALRGKPVALDPAVRRWPDDLRAPVTRRLAIEMGQPRR